MLYDTKDHWLHDQEEVMAYKGLLALCVCDDVCAEELKEEDD